MQIVMDGNGDGDGASAATASRESTLPPPGEMQAALELCSNACSKVTEENRV